MRLVLIVFGYLDYLHALDYCPILGCYIFIVSGYLDYLQFTINKNAHTK